MVCSVPNKKIGRLPPEATNCFGRKGLLLKMMFGQELCHDAVMPPNNELDSYKIGSLQVTNGVITTNGINGQLELFHFYMWSGFLQASTPEARKIWLTSYGSLVYFENVGTHGAGTVFFFVWIFFYCRF